MQNLLDILSEITGKAFIKAGYDGELGRVSVSNRPDLCEFQCNGAMAGAKKYGKAPIQIAEEVAEILKEDKSFGKVEAVKPGFLNLDISESFLSEYAEKLSGDEKLGTEDIGKGRTIIVDYGGANVAKPLHIGHLRSAVIGESVKRILSFCGYRTIGDVHLGDVGLQMGLIITELKERQPKLPYFDESFTGDYPKDAPFTLSDLEEIYPKASTRSKEDEAYREAAQKATLKLQEGHRGYHALWEHILRLSKEDLKKNYDNLDVHFELWKGESDAIPYVKDMVDSLVEKGIAYESEGALVVDIAEESDPKEYPPCIVRKSDGAANYETSDLGTLVEREKLYSPDGYVYLADKRQELHYTQFFRVAKRGGIVKPDSELKFIGFGTMNGKDGKPFKTRAGGVLRLEYLIKEINEAAYEKIKESNKEKGREVSEEEARETARIVGLAALKYGDLSNQAVKDYVFDMDRFMAFEGNTGPYILYTIVRINSILEKYGVSDEVIKGYSFNAKLNESEKALMLKLSQVNQILEGACEELAPHKICSFIYDVANEFNRFYHGTKILSEENEERKQGYIALISFANRVLKQCITLLGFAAPQKM